MLNRDLVIGSQLLQCPEVCASCSEAKVAQTFRHAAGLLDRESDLLLAVTGAPVAHTRTLVRAPDGKDVLLARNLGSWGARNRTRTWRTKTSRAAVTPLPSKSGSRRSTLAHTSRTGCAGSKGSLAGSSDGGWRAAPEPGAHDPLFARIRNVFFASEGKE